MGTAAFLLAAALLGPRALPPTFVPLELARRAEAPPLARRVTPPSWRLVVSGPAARDLERLPEKAAAAVVESFQGIAADPQRVGKPLRFELEGLRSARRGPYRVIYRIDAELRVVAVGHRADVYRRR